MKSKPQRPRMDIYDFRSQQYGCFDGLGHATIKCHKCTQWCHCTVSHVGLKIDVHVAAKTEHFSHTGNQLPPPLNQGAKSLQPDALCRSRGCFAEIDTL